MLKHRLVFGLLMTVAFVGLMLVDGWLDGSITSSVLDDKPVQGTLLCILVALLIIPAQFELRTLSAAKNMKIFIPVAVTSSILFATTWYWPQLIAISPAKYLALVLAFTLFALFLYQHFNFGNSGVIANCGANYFAIIYTGLLAAFIPAIRIEFGLWALLMFIFVIKSSDIGAYTAGKLFGKHKFSPKISPAKTWEGMAGAVIFAVVVSMLFAQNFDIMPWPFAVAFQCARLWWNIRRS
jgi:phosphatidate cytidylyltransferase